MAAVAVVQDSVNAAPVLLIDQQVELRGPMRTPTAHAHLALEWRPMYGGATTIGAMVASAYIQCALQGQIGHWFRYRITIRH